MGNISKNIIFFHIFTHLLVEKKKKYLYFLTFFLSYSTNSSTPPKKIDNIVNSMQFDHKKFHQNGKGDFSARNKTLLVLNIVRVSANNNTNIQYLEFSFSIPPM